MKDLVKLKIAVLFTLITFTANAQRIGIKGGISLSTMTEKTETYSLYDIKMISGFHVGADIDIKLNKFLSLEPGVILTTSGAEYKYDRMGNYYNLKYNEYFINFPLLLKGEIKLCDKIGIYGLIGPYIGTGFSGELKETRVAIYDYPDYEPETSKRDHSKGTAYGTTFGIGIEHRSFFFETLLDYGIDYDKDQAADAYFPDQTRIIRFSIGYRLGN